MGAADGSDLARRRAALSGCQRARRSPRGSMGTCPHQSLPERDRYRQRSGWAPGSPAKSGSRASSVHGAAALSEPRRHHAQIPDRAGRRRRRRLPRRGSCPTISSARRTAGNVIRALGIVAFHASPVWVLAALADVCGMGRHRFEIADALKARGLLDAEAEFARSISCWTAWSGRPPAGRHDQHAAARRRGTPHGWQAIREETGACRRELAVARPLAACGTG